MAFLLTAFPSLLGSESSRIVWNRNFLLERLIKYFEDMGLSVVMFLQISIKASRGNSHHVGTHLGLSAREALCWSLCCVRELSGNLPSEGLRAGAVKGFLFTDPIKALFAKQ